MADSTRSSSSFSVNSARLDAESNEPAEFSPASASSDNFGLQTVVDSVTDSADNRSEIWS